MNDNQTLWNTVNRLKAENVKLAERLDVATQAHVGLVKKKDAMEKEIVSLRNAQGDTVAIRSLENEIGSLNNEISSLEE